MALRRAQAVDPGQLLGRVQALPRRLPRAAHARAVAGRRKTSSHAALACVESLPGYTLQRVLALGALKVNVLDKDGRGAEGSARLKAAIHQMLGESPAAEQLAELAPALGGAIDLATVLAAPPLHAGQVGDAI